MLVSRRFQSFRTLLSSDSLCSHNQTPFSCELESLLTENGFFKTIVLFTCCSCFSSTTKEAIALQNNVYCYNTKQGLWMRERNQNRARRMGVSGWLKREWLDAEKKNQTTIISPKTRGQNSIHAEPSPKIPHGFNNKL